MSVSASSTVSISPAAIVGLRARRGSWRRTYLAAELRARLWSRRHANARARRRHRPPGARARPARGRAAAARRRHHQPQLPRAARRRGPRRAPVRRRRRGARHRPRGRGDRHAARRRARASRPAVVAFLADVPALVTRWLPGGDVAAEQLRAPGRPGAGRARCCAVCTPTPALPTRLRRLPRSSSDQRALAGARVPDSYERLLAPCSHADRGGADRPRARARPLPQRPADRQLPRATATACGSSTGSTRGWATATSTSATSRSTTASTTTTTRALLERLLRRAVRPTRRFAALRLMRVMSRLPRGDVGRRAARRSRARLRLRRATRDEHFDAAASAPPPTRACEDWLADAATA